MLPKSLQEAIDAFSDLPGIGNRSAERLVLGLLKNKSPLPRKLINSLTNLLDEIEICADCGNFREKNAEQCIFCRDEKREKSSICVVENPLDCLAIERTFSFRGLYHILNGVLSPINRVSAEDLNLESLFSKNLENIEEIILALGTDTESEATILFLTEKLKEKNFRGKVSRIARGIPSGGNIEYLDSHTLGRAILDRQNISLN